MGNRLITLVESRIRGDVYVRFGGEYLETCHSNMVRRWVLSLQSGKTAMAHFITSCIFDKPLKVVRIDKGIQDYYMRLTTFFGQFRGIATNYNQIVKSLNANFTEKKALAFLYKLEQQTIELAQLNRQIIALTAGFEQRYLQAHDR